MAGLGKEALDYLRSLENEEGNLNHLDINDPKLQRLRVMIGAKPIANVRVKKPIPVSRKKERVDPRKINYGKLHELKESKGWNFIEVGQRMGITTNMALGRFNQTARFKPEELEKLAEVFGVEMEELMR